MKTAFKSAIATACLAAGLAMTAPASATTNLITNGDFEAGNTGFSSDYTYVAAAGSNALVPEGTYAVGTNAADYHYAWQSYGDHTTGSGNYMIINGATTSDPTVNIWRSNQLTLTAGTYNFSAWTANSCCNSSYGGPNASPDLYFVGTDGTITLPGSLNASPVAGPGVWTETSITVTIPFAVTGYVALRDSDGAGSGNDFGLDDVSLTAAVPETATWTMMIGGIGLVGGLMRRGARGVSSRLTA